VGFVLLAFAFAGGDSLARVVKLAVLRDVQGVVNATMVFASVVEVGEGMIAQFLPCASTVAQLAALVRALSIVSHACKARVG